MNEKRIEDAVKKAEDAFWAAVAAQFPEAKTGDVGPEATMKLANMMERAIREWVDENVGEPVA